MPYALRVFPASEISHPAASPQTPGTPRLRGLQDCRGSAVFLGSRLRRSDHLQGRCPVGRRGATSAADERVRGDPAGHRGARDGRLRAPRGGRVARRLLAGSGVTCTLAYASSCQSRRCVGDRSPGSAPSPPTTLVGLRGDCPALVCAELARPPWGWSASVVGTHPRSSC
jgi:hypothetical protein